MPQRQSKAQQETVGRVMHEFKHGELESGSGRKVKSRKQAVAIALKEAGSAKDETPARNARNLKRTKAGERKAEMARDRGETRAELYAEAKRRELPGRSRMSKADLARALR